MKSVLVVDDDPDIRALVAAKLSQVGFSVRQAVDGEDGLRAALGQPPDLILLDLMMPKLSGADVCRELRRHGATRATPILLLTARTQEPRGPAAGFDGCITKPFSPRDLASRIAGVIGEP